MHHGTTRHIHKGRRKTSFHWFYFWMVTNPVLCFFLIWILMLPLCLLECKITHQPSKMTQHKTLHDHSFFFFFFTYLNVEYFLFILFPLTLGNRKLHADHEGTITHRSLFPAAVALLLSGTYTAEHWPLLAPCCKQHSGSLGFIQHQTYSMYCSCWMIQIPVILFIRQ